MAKSYITVDASALKSFDYATFLADYYSTTGTAAGSGVWADGEYSESVSSFSSGSQWWVSFAEAGNDRAIVMEGDDMQYDAIEDIEVHGYSGTVRSIEFGYKYSQTGYDQVDGESRSEIYNLGHGLKISGLELLTEFGTGMGTDNEMYALMNDLRRHASTSSTYIEDLYTLFGSKAQHFIGSRNADTYTGTAFKDLIDGGKGIDELDGGAGKDTFLFSKGDTGKTIETADSILNFELGIDRIDLSDIDAIAGKKGDQAFTWINSKDFSGKAGQLQYERIDGQTYISGDTNGDKVADFVIHLEGEFKLTADSFIL